MKTVLMFALGLGMLTAAFGQEMMAVPKEMTNLEGLVGEWEGSLSMTIPGMTDPMLMASTVSVKSFGMYQETVYTLNGGGMKMTGHQFLTWDTESKGYKAWNFDDQAPSPRIETGTWDGKKLVMTGEQGGMTTRVTFEPKSKDLVHFMLEMKQGDGFVKLGEANYKRKS